MKSRAGAMFDRYKKKPMIRLGFMGGKIGKEIATGFGK
jgi:hypothetical protein